MTKHLVRPMAAKAMNPDYQQRDHFRAIAPRYGSLRTTDERPITFIAQELGPVPAIKAADVGCGTGRYTCLLLRRLQEKAPLIHCIDYSAAMLRQLRRHFAEQAVQAASTIKASAMCLPLRNETLNCIFTFNAVHHFALPDFLRESARILQAGGYLFVYTRLRSQNSRTIWGRHFPLFASKETRLYELDELEGAIGRVPTLRLEKVQTFRFGRQSKLADLIHRAHNHHYSTFDLYLPGEFRSALGQFSNRLLEHFGKRGNIRWIDENILLILRKAG